MAEIIVWPNVLKWGEAASAFLLRIQVCMETDVLSGDNNVNCDWKSAEGCRHDEMIHPCEGNCNIISDPKP